MPNRFHEGARRSRLQDRKAACRRRGLDGRQQRRDQNFDRSPLAFMCRIVVTISDRLASAALVRGV
jgi:hypothetical protein